MHHLSAKIKKNGAEETTMVMAWKTSLEKWSRAASNFIALIPSRLIRSNVGFWGWILKDCIEVQEKKKKVVVLLILYTPCTKLLFKSSRKCRLQDVSVFFSLLSYCTRNPRTRAAINKGVSPSPKSLLLLAIDALAGILREKCGLQAFYQKYRLCGRH